MKENRGFSLSHHHPCRGADTLCSHGIQYRKWNSNSVIGMTKLMHLKITLNAYSDTATSIKLDNCNPALQWVLYRKDSVTVLKQKTPHLSVFISLHQIYRSSISSGRSSMSRHISPSYIIILVSYSIPAFLPHHSLVLWCKLFDHCVLHFFHLDGV